MCKKNKFDMTFDELVDEIKENYSKMDDTNAKTVTVEMLRHVREFTYVNHLKF